MTPIPDAYSANGYDYRLHSRDGNVAIYEQGRGGDPAAYEVVKIRRGKGFPGPDGKRDVIEKLPCNAEWGVRGFTFSKFGRMDGGGSALAAAKGKMSELIAAAAA